MSKLKQRIFVTIDAQPCLRVAGEACRLQVLTEAPNRQTAKIWDGAILGLRVALIFIFLHARCFA